jgi:ribosome biogenesis protein Nip4
MRELEDFLERIGSTYEARGVRLNINDRRFSIDPDVAEHIHDRGRLVCAGRLLGRTRKNFIPGAGLLRELGKIQGPNKVWVDERVGWLFVCGRDIFSQSILRSEGELAEGTFFLVMMGCDCLGYGVIQRSDGGIILKNLFDIGDFLRRERGLEKDT